MLCLLPPFTFGFELAKKKALALFTKLLTQLLNSNYCWTGLLNTSPCLAVGAPVRGVNKRPFVEHHAPQ